VLVKNYPLAMLLRAPFATGALLLARGVGGARAGRGGASAKTGNGLEAGAVRARAHLALAANLPKLWRKRREVGAARISRRIPACIQRITSARGRLASL